MKKIICLAIIVFLSLILGCDTINDRDYKIDEKENKIEYEKWPEPQPGDRIITGDYVIAKPRNQIITEKPKSEIFSFEIPTLPELY
jgi:hypothetical protein